MAPVSSFNSLMFSNKSLLISKKCFRRQSNASASSLNRDSSAVYSVLIFISSFFKASISLLSKINWLSFSLVLLSAFKVAIKFLSSRI